MKILYLGDVMGRAGRRAISEGLAPLKERLRVDFTVVNGENASGGMGLTAAHAALADLLIAAHQQQARAGTQAVAALDQAAQAAGSDVLLRDLARLGQLVLNEGRMGDAQVIPPEAVARIRQGGSKDTFVKAGYNLLPGWSYQGMWWVSHDDHGSFAARGVHGQTIWIDPTAQMVIVRFASNPVAGNAASDPTSLPAYRAVADYLMAQETAPQLIGREWLIEDISGKGVIDNSPASLLFLPDGKLAGNATCNRLVASYTVDGEALSIGQAGATRMACPPALMEQEAALLTLLPSVSGYSIDATGALVLVTPSGETITARRN